MNTCTCTACPVAEWLVYESLRRMKTAKHRADIGADGITMSATVGPVSATVGMDWIIRLAAGDVGAAVAGMTHDQHIALHSALFTPPALERLHHLLAKGPATAAEIDQALEMQGDAGPVARALLALSDKLVHIIAAGAYDYGKRWQEKRDERRARLAKVAAKSKADGA